jgi:hypothetical protein
MQAARDRQVLLPVHFHLAAAAALELLDKMEPLIQMAQMVDLVLLHQ